MKKFFCIVTKGKEEVPDIRYSVTSNASVVDENHLIRWLKKVYENYLHVKVPFNTYNRIFNVITGQKTGEQKSKVTITSNTSSNQFVMDFYVIPENYSFVNDKKINIGWIEDQNGMRDLHLFSDYSTAMGWAAGIAGSMVNDDFVPFYSAELADRIMISYESKDENGCVLHICHGSYLVNGFPGNEPDAYDLLD